MLALVGTAAALGAIDVAVPAAARENGNVAAAGVLLAVMAVGTVAGSLLAGGRTWRWSPQRRVVVLQLVMGAGIAVAALAVSARTVCWRSLCCFPGRRSGCCSRRCTCSSTGYHLRDRERKRSRGWSPRTTGESGSEPPWAER